MSWRSSIACTAVAVNLIVLGVWPLAADPPLVDKAIAFHGGATYEQAQVSFTISSGSGGFDVEATLDGERFEYIVSAEGEKTRYTDRELARSSSNGWQTLDGHAADEARTFVMSRVFLPFLPYGLNGSAAFQGPTNEDLGLETWNGRQLHKVKAQFPGGVAPDGHRTFMFWFDPDSGRLEQFAYDFTIEGGGVRFRKPTTYHKAGGLLFFDSENWGVNGQGLTVDQVTPDFVTSK
ncbi:MAG: hypothetical protein GEV06_27790, partial [Luteitalea sp.]|nr:hypothetical protein [Luteitalea sp.]